MPCVCETQNVLLLNLCVFRIQEERDERHRMKGRVSRFEPLPNVEGRRSCKLALCVFVRARTCVCVFYDHGVTFVPFQF